MGYKRSYREIKQDSKRHIAELAIQPPDLLASERFRKPAYQPVRTGQGLRRVDLEDYMIQRIRDGSIRLPDAVQPDAVRRIDDGNIDITDHLTDRYKINREG